MMTNRSDGTECRIKKKEQLQLYERARNGDTEAALAALDEWNLRQLQEMGPPDVERAQELYTDGEVNEQELEVLVEAAMQYYPPDGKRESRGKTIGIIQDADPLYPALKILFLTGIMILLALLLVELGQPPTDPNTVPPL